MKKATSQKKCSCGPRCSCKNCTCSPQARCFDALGNTTRLQIIFLLRSGAKTVTEITRLSGTEQSAVSHSLKTLENCGLVTSKQEGKHRRYSLAQAVEPLLALVEKHLKEKPLAQEKPCCCS